MNDPLLLILREHYGTDRDYPSSRVGITCECGEFFPYDAKIGNDPRDAYTEHLAEKIRENPYA